MVAVGDEDRERLQRAVNRGMQGSVGDLPQAVLGPSGSAKRDRRPALADDVDNVWQPAGASFVEEPERLESYVGGTYQSQPVFFRSSVGALMRQDDAIFVRLEPQGGDQVPPPLAVEPNFVDVHRGGIGPEDALAQPFIKGAGGAVVVPARTRQPDGVVRRERLIARHLCVGDDVIRWGHQRARLAGLRKVVPNPRQGANVSDWTRILTPRTLRLRLEFAGTPRTRALHSGGPPFRPPREAWPARLAPRDRPRPGSSSRCLAARRARPACSRC